VDLVVGFVAGVSLPTVITIARGVSGVVGFVVGAFIAVVAGPVLYGVAKRVPRQMRRLRFITAFTVAVLRRRCGASVCVDVAIRQSSWNGHGWRNCPSHLRNRGGGRSSPFTPTKPLKATAPFEAMESGKTRGRGYAVVALQLHAGAATSLTRRDSNGLQISWHSYQNPGVCSRFQ
jgi:hypothetical protein